eukprot:c21246_g1_i1.p1 GENE.c21246_g1_i1~~c21246_g1_i1.p1  ORF type:complete len:340 (+),score=60.84 c21246_g1_i1:56-1021(+)
MRWMVRAMLTSWPDSCEVLNHELYYAIRGSMLPPKLREVAVEMTCDEQTQEFVRECLNPTWYDRFATVSAYFVKRFMSLTDTNALLGRGQMHVITTHQFLTLMKNVQDRIPLQTEMSEIDKANQWLLDVGAGDGQVTQQFSDFFGRVVTTEVATNMCRRLRQRGFECIQTAQLSREALGLLPEQSFTLVSCLNVLDRCHYPMTMLRNMRELLHPTKGVLLLALVLPWCPFVEDGTGQVAPIEQLNIPPGCPCKGNVRKMEFETSVQYFTMRVLEPCGFRVTCVSRVPYLCKGDDYKPYYSLDDALFVCVPDLKVAEGDLFT